jgi:hypothetical protein
MILSIRLRKASMSHSTNIAEEMTTNWMQASRSIRAVINNEDNEFKQTIDKIRYITETYDIPGVLVGGLAVIKHGYHRTTGNIDVVAAVDQLSKLVESAQKEGFGFDHLGRGWHRLSYNGVRVGLVPEGSRASKTAPTLIPGPGRLGVTEGLKFVCLPGLMELKISSGRYKDHSDVIELIKRVRDEDIMSCKIHLEKVHPDYLQKFAELYERAKEEMIQEEERGGRRK